MRYYKPKKFTPIQQYLFLNKSSLINRKARIKQNILNCNFEARPTPLSRTYKIRLKFDGRMPKTYVIYPKITELAEGRRIPHLYNQKKQELCLFYPKYGEWKPDKIIADTIVPWVYLWLFYFEVWLITDEWKGGGKEPDQ